MLTVPGVELGAILTENADCGLPPARETARGLEANGVDGVIVSVDIGAPDHAGIVQRIMVEDPGVTITLVAGAAAGNFARQAADAGIGPMDPPFRTGQDALDRTACGQNVPDRDRAFVQCIGVPESQFTDKGRALAAATRNRTGKAGVGSQAMEAHDGIAILARDRDRSHAIFVGALRATTPRPGDALIAGFGCGSRSPSRSPIRRRTAPLTAGSSPARNPAGRSPGSSAASWRWA